MSQVAVAKPAEAAVSKPEGLKMSKLKNGLTVASIETHGPVTTLGIVVKCGVRNETYQNAGVCHMIRIAAGLGTKHFTPFGITKNLQQMGASLVCTQGREHTMYTIQATRDQVDLAMEYLADVVSSQMFKPWELGDSMPRMKVELALVPPATLTTELLHQAAFRTGLGNSLYCPAHMVGKHGTATMKDFVAKHFTAGRAAVVGLGIPHATLTKYSDLVTLEAGSGAATAPSKYSGGEERRVTGGNLAYVAIAGDAAGAVNVKDAVSNLLLQRILGAGSQVKRGVGMGKLSRAAAAATSAQHAVAGIGQMYSDTGLIGAMVVAEAAAAGAVVESVVAAVRSASVTEEEVARAKKNLLTDIYSIYEKSTSKVEDIGAQILLAGDVVPEEKVKDLVAGVNLADVNAAAKKLSNAKLSMAAVGNLSTVPYLDSL